MKGQHPYWGISKDKQRMWFKISSTATVFMIFVFMSVFKELKTPETPLGIIDLQFAGNLTNALKILGIWTVDKYPLVMFNLGIDYLFAILYPLSISLGCALIVNLYEERSKIIFAIGVIISWSQFFAGGFDLIENSLLSAVVLGIHDNSFVAAATVFALAKYSIVIIGLLYFFILTFAYPFLGKNKY